jgi:hypothetical protein
VDSKRELHRRRLQESLDSIPDLNARHVSVGSAEYHSWSQRIVQSLTEVFSDKSSYFKRASDLLLIKTPRSIALGVDESKVMASAYQQTESILRDSLEEFNLTHPGDEPAARHGYPPFSSPPSSQAPVHVVVNVNQTQLVSVNVTQYLERLSDLELPEDARKEAEASLKELSEEFKGQHRWEKMGPTLSALSAIGKGVYEKVALPLLAELAKKAVGL